MPNHLHAPLTIAAAQAGKHVLCEKPLALSLDEVDAIAAAAEAAGVVVTEAFMYRHHPLTLRVQQLVAEGAIGRPLTVRGSFSFPLSNDGDVRHDPDMGGGSLWDVGCYPASYARTVLQEAPVEAMGWSRAGPTGVDMTFWGALRFPSGAVAQLDSSFEAPFRTHLEVVGTEAMIVVPEPFKPEQGATYLIGPSHGPPRGGAGLRRRPLPRRGRRHHRRRAARHGAHGHPGRLPGQHRHADRPPPVG